MKVELRDIHKSFGPVRANWGINLTIPPGTIFGLLGENGAGKSTLMNILSGYYRQDSGRILLDDEVVSISSPADAIRQGIGMLHQDPLDFPPMRVMDNFLIGHGGGLVPDLAAGRRGFRELSEAFDFNIDPQTYVDTLTVGERQQLEILRLLWLGARVLIFDEPTTGISAQQKEKLFDALRRLAEEGRSVIFVSHKLEEIQDLCSRAAVLRKGELVGELNAPYNLDRLVEMMFGKVVSKGEREAIEQGGEVLEVRNLAIEQGRLEITDVNLTVRRGEVIGLAGMEGSGQSMLLKVCAGLVRPVRGRVKVSGKDMTGKRYQEFLRQGVSYMPASRLEEGLIPGMTLLEHFLLSRDTGSPVINWERGKEIAQQQIDSFSIVGRPQTQVEALSGGNQQRALLALLRPDRKLILLEHPTRGLDIESAIWVWEKLKERCRAGSAIFFISSDLEEILDYSDRILVFFGGRISRPLDARQTSVENLGHLIGGRGFDEVQQESRR